MCNIRKVKSGHRAGVYIYLQYFVVLCLMRVHHIYDTYTIILILYIFI